MTELETHLLLRLLDIEIPERAKWVSVDHDGEVGFWRYKPIKYRNMGVWMTDWASATANDDRSSSYTQVDYTFYVEKTLVGDNEGCVFLIEDLLKMSTTNE